MADDKKHDPVYRPQHYAYSIEVLDAIESWGLGFHAGNAVKYIARAKRKGNEIEDLKKAVFYLERLIDRLIEGKEPKAYHAPKLVRLTFAEALKDAEAASNTHSAIESLRAADKKGKQRGKRRK